MGCLIPSMVSTSINYGLASHFLASALLLVGRCVKKWLSVVYPKHAQLDLNPGTSLANPYGL
jgi:hypothetical protein